jgi:hypothetical protein
VIDRFPQNGSTFDFGVVFCAAKLAAARFYTASADTRIPSPPPAPRGVHPSGVAEPSKADKYITDRVKQALAFVDIKVLDHIIVAGGETMSFAERGMI